jgi:hypothetical protein
VLWSQPVLQVGKQVVVVWSEIGAVKRVVKLLPVEMLQQCSSVSSCLRMCTVMEGHYTVCQHSHGPIVLFFSFTVHFWHYCGPLLHKFHHQHSSPVPENRCHQLSGRQCLHPLL